MIAYGDRKTGDILFADKKPRGGLLIAEHPSLDILREAIKFSGAQHRAEYRGGKQISEPSLAVPWFSTAKIPEDEEERVRHFAGKVRAWLGDQSCVH